MSALKQVVAEEAANEFMRFMAGPSQDRRQTEIPFTTQTFLMPAPDQFLQRS
jgi:hypothetical protein